MQMAIGKEGTDMKHEVTAWNPMRSMLSLQGNMDDLFRDLLRGFGGMEGADGWAPASDIEETDDAFVVTADLPGLSQKDISITVRDNVLNIHGERKAERRDGKGAHRRVERFAGIFSRSFALPSSVKPDDVQAKYKDGVLTVTLPKREEAKPRQITVKTD